MQAIIDALLFIPNLILDLFKSLWAEIIDALAGVIEAIPPPDFVTAIPTYVEAIPESFWYVGGMLGIKEGLAITIGAYTLRFIIRRLPVIG